MNKILKKISIVVCVLAMAACASNQPQPKEPVKLKLSFIANSQLNPDTKNRPSPIMVRLYELKNPSTFEQADYFSLFDKDKIILGEDMLVKDEFIMRPGEEKRIDRKSHPQTTAIGILAGYRDLSISNWRVVYPLENVPEASWFRFALPNKTVKFEIQLNQNDLLVIEPKKLF